MKALSDFVQFEDETILWTASLILLNHLQKPDIRRTFEGKRVLELGSGLGHLGYGLSRFVCVSGLHRGFGVPCKLARGAVLTCSCSMPPGWVRM